MTVFPTNLPLPKAEFQGQVKAPVISTTMESGRARQRRRYSASREKLSVQWVFDSLQFQAFENWFFSQLENGQEKFEIELRYPAELTTFTAEFLTNYTTEHKDGRWTVSADLEVTQTEP